MNKKKEKIKLLDLDYYNMPLFTLLEEIEEKINEIIKSLED